MGPEIVSILAGGTKWGAFKSVTVSRKFKDAALSFSMTIAAAPGAAATAWTFKAGTPIEIYFNADLVFRGYVDRYKPKKEEHGSAEITVSGRSKSQDAIDCSAIHKTGHFKDKSPADIANELDQFGIGISTDQELAKVTYRLTPGETLFRCLEKLCRSQAVWPVGQPDGSILITIAGQGRNGAIIDGVNMKTGEADHNWSGRHSKVIARGQRAQGHGKDNLEIEATATDAEVDRNRPIIVMQDDDTDRDRTKKRAKHRRDSEAGNSLKATVKVQGFRDDAGTLWAPGNLVFLESEFLGITQDMAIDAAEYTQERDKGSETTLTLVDPRALGAKGGRKGGKADAAWSTDAGDDAEDTSGSAQE